MLGHRLRRWPNIETTLDSRLVLAGLPTHILHAQSDALLFDIFHSFGTVIADAIAKFE